ncbi:MAG TPA: CPCC family cysteine-rich protein [Mucilaginibacter sp.]|nr:CPCC family cysteine-rich protein [Mucilaginibacter sp.]
MSDKNKWNKYRCICCGFFTLEEPTDNSFQLCPVCFWEDDGVQSDDPDYEGGANEVSLNIAKINFKTFGAIDSGAKKFVRDPESTELDD